MFRKAKRFNVRIVDNSTLTNKTTTFIEHQSDAQVERTLNIVQRKNEAIIGKAVIEILIPLTKCVFTVLYNDEYTREYHVHSFTK